MMIRIIKSSPGCIYLPGELIRVNNKRARRLIDIGVAECVDVFDDGISDPQPIEEDFWDLAATLPGADGVMAPMRYICRCGYVAKTERDQQIHQEACDHELDT